MSPRRRGEIGLLPLVAILIAVGFMLPATPAREKKKDDGYVAIFDGKSLNGWDCDPDFWRVDSLERSRRCDAGEEG